MTESICLITTKCFHKTAQSPLSWETTKAVPSPWKPVLLAHYRSATIDAKAGRIWALCVLGDTRGYVTVKGIGIPLTLSEKLASPRKEENEIERFLNSTKTRPLSLHRTVSHLLAEYSGFEATMMEKIRNPKHQSKQNERDKEILSHWQFLLFKSNSYDFEIWMSHNQNSLKPGKHKQHIVRLMNYIRENYHFIKPISSVSRFG